MKHLPGRPLRSRNTANFSAALSLTVGLISSPAAAAPTAATDVVRGFYATLLSTMMRGRMLGPSGRYAQLDPVVHQTFDIPFMTRLAVGPSWSSLTPDQQQRVTAAFERYVAAVYAEPFDSYTGEKLEVAGERPFGSDIIVQSRIVKSDGEPVRINYLMRRNRDAWQISDVYLDGTISELATRRSDFAAILRDRGIDGLIIELNRKSDVLAAKVAAGS